MFKLFDHGLTLFSIIFYFLIQYSGYSYTTENLKTYRNGFIFLVSSTLVATLLISSLKSITHIDCPWSINGLGGEQEYVPWIQLLFRPHEGGRCFPSGHASAAYAFFSLYFFAHHYFSKYASIIFIAVVIVGLIFGFAQQLRGAHFVSHDVTTAFLCWIVNLLFYYLFLVKDENKLNR